MEVILSVIIATGVMIGFNHHESKMIENYLEKQEANAKNENRSELVNDVLITNLKSEKAL